ncbi:hypothetical protein [Nocardioides sp.]|uniref:hypothetical protein n=1 Tax=Nocardioides sp. TaxID=35761 RepID=UPI003783BDB6
MTTGRAARGRTLLLAALGVLVVALLLVVGSPLVDTDVVADRQQQTSVNLGLPLPWVHQDQSAADPPLPTQSGLSSPWEHVTSISPGAFLLDAVVVFLVLALVAGLAVALVGRVRSAHRASGRAVEEVP